MTEVMVVIAIVAVIAAILLPVVSKAKLRAKMIGSATNIRQMLIAIQIYGADAADTFPFGLPKFWADKRPLLPSDLIENGYSAPYLEDVLRTYGCTESVYKAPADPGLSYEPVHSRYATSYSFRIRAFLEPKSMSFYGDPAAYPLIHEAGWFYSEPGIEERRMVGYIDGHIRFGPWREVADLMDERPKSEYVSDVEQRMLLVFTGGCRLCDQTLKRLRLLRGTKVRVVEHSIDGQLAKSLKLTKVPSVVYRGRTVFEGAPTDLESKSLIDLASR